MHHAAARSRLLTAKIRTAEQTFPGRGSQEYDPLTPSNSKYLHSHDKPDIRPPLQHPRGKHLHHPLALSNATSISGAGLPKCPSA